MSSGLNIAPAQFDKLIEFRRKEYDELARYKVETTRFADNLEDMYTWYDKSHSITVYNELLARNIEVIVTLVNAIPGLEDVFPKGIVDELLRLEKNNMNKVRLHLVKAAVERYHLPGRSLILRYVREKSSTLPHGVLGDINPDIFGQGTSWANLACLPPFENVLSPLGPAKLSRWTFFIMQISYNWRRVLLSNPCFVYNDEGETKIFSRSGSLTSYVCEYGAKVGPDRESRMEKVLAMVRTPAVSRRLAYLPIDIGLAYYWKEPGHVDKLWNAESYADVLAKESYSGEPFAYWHTTLRELIHN